MTAQASRPTLPSGDLMTPRREMAPCLASGAAQAAILNASHPKRPVPPPPVGEPLKGSKPKGKLPPPAVRSVARDDDRVAVLEDAIVCLAEVGGVNGIKIDGLQAWARDVTAAPATRTN